MMVGKVAVYAASSTQVDESFFEAARQLGRELAVQGITLINGAGNMGLMKASADACLQAGGEAVGIIPHFMVEQNWHHTGMTRLIETPDMHTRKKAMAEMSDGCVALPGGCGTMEELLEVITWKQLGLYLNPIVILNINGYYDSLISMLEHAAACYFMRKEHLKIWSVAQTAQEAVQQLLSTPKWDASVRRFAAI